MTSYNLTSKGEQVRIGNWQEELALKENTGIRFYPNPKDRALSLITQERCITHTDQLKPKDYQSTLRSTIGNPMDHPEYTRGTVIQGPRQKRLEEAMQSEVKAEFEQREKADFMETRKVHYESSTQAGYMHPPFERRVDEKGTDRIATKAANYSTDMAVTYYSHVVGAKGLKANFPTTFVGSTNPFKKHCPFSTKEYLAVYSRRAETHERPKTLPTLKDHRTLGDFRDRLLKAAFKVEYGTESPLHFDGRAIRAIIGMLWSRGSQIELVTVQELEDTISSTFSGFKLSADEKNSLLVTFDLWNDGAVSLLELTHHIRKTPSPRRLELIDIYFVNLDAAGTGVIDEHTVREKISSASHRMHLETLLKAFNFSSDEEFGINVDDFFDYYIDVSNELYDNNSKFDQLLIDTWGKF